MTTRITRSMAKRECGGIFIENSAGDILSSNYWDLEESARGFIFCSPNAGTIRVLVPEKQDVSDWITRCKYVIYSRGPMDLRTGQRLTELLFEDHSDSPFSLQLGSSSWMTLPADPGPDKFWRISIWTRRDARPTQVWQGKCYWRSVPRIPWLKPLQKQ